MPTHTLSFEIGKVYCISFPDENDTIYKRLVLFRGMDHPWEDICSGETAHFDPDCLIDVTEVPGKVVEAIRLAQGALELADSKEAPVCLAALAAAHARAGHYDEASKTIQRAVALSRESRDQKNAKQFTVYLEQFRALLKELESSKKLPGPDARDNSDANPAAEAAPPSKD